MSNAFEPDAEQLSALADGELDDAGIARVCARWRAGAPLHATWHAYHLIGDVLRSEDLASSASRDHASLARLRAKLAGEPVILAPVASAGRVRSEVVADRGWRKSAPWGAVSAVAAGFAAAAGVLVILRGPVAGSDSQSTSLARNQAQALAPFTDTASRPAEREPQAMLADGRLVRDARLDRYLDAHKHFSGSSALGVPSSFLRGATSDATNR